MIFVRGGEVGKTTLIKVLKGGKFLEGMKKTEGIAITHWPLILPDGEATALVWDFGGQVIMHGTHQFFLTHWSLYLVVVDGRHGRAKQDAEYWLKLICAFGGQSPVLVILRAQRRHALDTDREAEEILSPEELFPVEWWSMKQRLGAMKEQLNVAKKDTQILLSRLSDPGTVVSFPDRRLRELTVLNPVWVTDGIYHVLNDDRLRQQRHGQLAWRELSRILPARSLAGEVAPLFGGVDAEVRTMLPAGIGDSERTPRDDRALR
jgi:internalin A